MVGATPNRCASRVVIGAAIIAAVESSESPAFLLLGPDALAAYQDVRRVVAESPVPVIA